MNEAEKLLEKFARKNMVQWNQESFKRTHSRLHKSIIEALSQALSLGAVSNSASLKSSGDFRDDVNLESQDEYYGRK